MGIGKSLSPDPTRGSGRMSVAEDAWHVSCFIFVVAVRALNSVGGTIGVDFTESEAISKDFIAVFLLN